MFFSYCNFHVYSCRILQVLQLFIQLNFHFNLHFNIILGSCCMPIPIHTVICHAHTVYHCFPQTGIETIGKSEVKVDGYQPPTQWSFNTLTPTIQLGIAIILILEYHFFLSQQDNQKSGKIGLELATTEYTKTKAAVVEKAVKDILRQYDGDEDKLCDMIIDIILQNRMSKVFEK
ncbi:hypothetical protein K503DRAFT_412906 [Rhizopogon vinicolor AM-OR11-026]|uniref:Uncharacterized protein n=1 Tax=Rhizopogon vinicolor AM-OR11-026 TaxID=1314800 RepID=A0A1B7MQH0_9AGAM|nr:hypothetical protein K503DRAFT_412906 [Rhizopogon vinicolor AM-OR11-026]